MVCGYTFGSDKDLRDKSLLSDEMAEIIFDTLASRSDSSTDWPGYPEIGARSSMSEQGRMLKPHRSSNVNI
jgi:hypothetical protein